MPVLQLAPSAGVAVAQFHKIDGAIKLRAPAERLNFAHALIHLHERTGPEKRMKSEILEADVTVEIVAEIEMLEQGDGDFAPDFDHAREEIGVVEIEGAVEAHGKGNGFVGVVDFEIGQMSVGQWGSELMVGDALQIHAKKEEQVRKFDMVNGGEGIEFEDAGNGIGIFELREPGIGNLKFGIAFIFSDFLAERFNVAGGDAQAKTQFSKIVTGRAERHREG